MKRMNRWTLMFFGVVIALFFAFKARQQEWRRFKLSVWNTWIRIAQYFVTWYERFERELRAYL